MYVPRTKVGIQEILVKGLVYMELTRLRSVIDVVVQITGEGLGIDPKVAACSWLGRSR
jgi:hypothetical protein